MPPATRGNRVGSRRHVFQAASAVLALTLSGATVPALAMPAPAARPSGTIRVGAAPDGIAVSPDGRRAYVTNSSADTVSVIDTATNSVVATYDVDEYPTGVAVSPDSSRMANTSRCSVGSFAIASSKAVRNWPSAA